jgi:hypothetical protein
MNQKMMIEQPSIETTFRRLVDGWGYHDADSIPTTVVLRMFEEIFKWEHRRNDALEKALWEYNDLILKPLVFPKKDDDESE